MSVKYIHGKNVLINGKLQPATIVIQDGKIEKIFYHEQDMRHATHSQVINAGHNVVMPALIDTHTHGDDPGRTKWEGIWTASRAGVAGGFGTLVDMPLQCVPVTTTTEALDTKMFAVAGKNHTDLKFWGGAVGNPADMKELLKRGVAGFKCFLIDCPAYVGFPSLNEKQADDALQALKGTGSVLMFHAEVAHGYVLQTRNTEDYQVVLNGRPASMEVEAIQLISRICKKNQDVRCHIVHLSATEALPIIADLKKNGYPLTVETCPHYLNFGAEDIGNGCTEYLALPPIRESHHREALWKALGDGLIDMIASDHANCSPDEKPRSFAESWGGIAGLQYGLPVVWTNARKRGYTIADVHRWMSRGPARLADLQNTKAEIKVGYDADFVIWDPEKQITIDGTASEYKNKVNFTCNNLTPYHGMKFYGQVLKTILHGEVIYDNGIFSVPRGKFLFSDWENNKNGVLFSDI